MAYKVNYGLERAERNRVKKEKKEAKLLERKAAAMAPAADETPEDGADEKEEP